MNIEMNLYASLSRYKPKGTGRQSWTESCGEGTTIHVLLQRLKIPIKEVKLIFLNGVHSTGETVLKHGDRLGVFPPVGGG